MHQVCLCSLQLIISSKPGSFLGMKHVVSDTFCFDYHEHGVSLLAIGDCHAQLGLLNKHIYTIEVAWGIGENRISKCWFLLPKDLCLIWSWTYYSYVLS